MNKATCGWVQWDPFESDFTWGTECGEAWSLSEGTPAENGVRFCFCCGKPTEFHPWVDDDEASE